jgi:hypothetical protein
MREKKVLASVNNAGCATAEELVPRAYDDTPVHMWPFALLSLQSHLEKLVVEGAVKKDGPVYSRIA